MLANQMDGHAKGERPRIISARRATKPALDPLPFLCLKLRCGQSEYSDAQANLQMITARAEESCVLYPQIQTINTKTHTRTQTQRLPSYVLLA